jgi:hypothetical protein
MADEVKKKNEKVNGVVRSLTFTDASVKKSRAINFSELLGSAHTTLVGELKNKISKLKSKKLSLEDFNAKSTTDLNQHLTNFDYDKWANDYQVIKTEIFILERELELANETTNYFFVDKDEEEEA